MRLFYLVEKHHAIGLSAHLFGELPGLVEPDVPGRRADQFRHRVLFHIFAHVYAYEVALVVEQTFRERLAELGFAHARRPHEDKAAERTVGVVQPGAGAPYGAGYALHGLALPDYAAAELLFQPQKPLRLRFRQLDGGNARLRGDDLRHVVFMEFEIGLNADFVLPVAHFTEFGGKFRARFFLFREPRRVAVARRLVLQHERAFQLALLLPHGLGQVVAVQPQAGGRLVDKVYRLVGQKSVRYIAVGQRNGRLDRVVADAHLVVRLVSVAQSL